MTPLLDVKVHEEFIELLKDKYGIESKPLTAPTGKIFKLKPRFVTEGPEHQKDKIDD